MSDSKRNKLAIALLDLKETYLISVSKRLISSSIPDAEILLLARTLPANKVIRKLKRSYILPYLWNKLMRGRRRIYNKGSSKLT